MGSLLGHTYFHTLLINQLEKQFLTHCSQILQYSLTKISSDYQILTLRLSGSQSASPSFIPKVA